MAPKDPEKLKKMGVLLRSLRTEREYSLEQAAVYAGITFAGLSLIERGKRSASLTTVRKLAELYGVSLDFIVDHKIPEEEANEGEVKAFLRSHDLDSDEIELILAFLDARKARKNNQ